MRRIQLLVAGLAIWILTTGAAAQVLQSTPRVEQLKNGLTVVMIPWDSPGMAAFYSLVRTGSRDETEKGHTGFAHLFEHMMFRGTDRFPKELYETKIQEFGADNNAFTWFNLTCYTVVVPTEVLPELIEIEADRFQNLKFSEADFKTETGAVLGEYNMNAANPGLLMEEKLLLTAFTKHTYSHSTMGYLADVKAMPGYYGYAKKFHKWFYTPDNTTLIVVGDFDADAVLKKISDEYGNWKGKRRKTRAKKEPAQKDARSVHVPWTGPTPPKMTMAYKTPAFSTSGADSAALEVLAQLVFGESSPLYRKLVIEEQKVLGLRASHGIFSPPSPDPFLFQVDVTLKIGTTFDEIQEAVTQAIAEVAEGKIPTERIEAVKSHARYSFLLGLETPKDVAVSLAMLMSATGDPGSIDAFGKALAEVTPEQIVEAAKNYLTAKRRTVVTMSTEEGGAK